MFNPMSLEGRTILVTGAGQGIGLAVSELVLELGGNVLAVDLNADTLEAEANRLGDAFLPMAGNVTDAEFAGRCVEQAVSRFGALHGLVNNAGITRPAMIHKMDQSQWQQVLDVHATGSFNFIQAAGRHMLERARSGDEQDVGSIVNVSSDAGRRGTIGQINYAAAKSAMLGMAMSAAREWGKFGIRANAVCFGVVETDMTQKIRTDEKISSGLLAQLPMGRWSTPREVSVPVCFLLSRGASYITGQTLSVNGGYNISI